MMFSRIYLFVPNVSQKGGGEGEHVFVVFFARKGEGGTMCIPQKWCFPHVFRPVEGGGATY